MMCKTRRPYGNSEAAGSSFPNKFVAVLLTVASVAAAAHPLDDPKLRQCLRGWEDWGLAARLPYFPRLHAGNCFVEEPDATAAQGSFGGLKPRRLKLEFGFDTQWYPGSSPGTPGSASYDHRYKDAAAAAIQHFARLLIAQGYRPAGAAAATEPQTALAIGPSAYERASSGGVRRVEFRPMGIDRLAIMLEQKRGALREDMRLPAPDASFDFTAPASARRLFALPGFVFVGDRIVFLGHRLPGTTIGGSGTGAEGIIVKVPVRTISFQTENPAPKGEVDAAVREALLQAGWKSLSEQVHYVRGDSLYRYSLSRGDLDAGFFYVDGPAAHTTLHVEFTDLSLAFRITSLVNRFHGQVQDWEIAPEFDASGNATERTRDEIFVFAAHTSRPPPNDASAKILVTPIASQGNERARHDAARHAARWVVEQLVQRGWHRSRIHLLEDVHPPRLKEFGVELGARVTTMACKARPEPGATPEKTNCECREKGTVVSTMPGACS